MSHSVHSPDTIVTKHATRLACARSCACAFYSSASGKKSKAPGTWTIGPRPASLDLADQFPLDRAYDAQHARDILGTRRHYEPAHAQLRVTPSQIAIQPGLRLGRDTDFDFLERPPVTRAGLAQPRYHLRGFVQTHIVSVPAIARAGGTAERIRRTAAPHNLWMGLLYRPRLGANGAEREELSVIFRLLHRPHRLHRRQRFFRSPSSIGKRNAQGAVLRFDRADAQPKD